MNAEEVQRDLNEIYRESTRRSQARFFGLSSEVVGPISSVTPIRAASDLKGDAWPKAGVEDAARPGLSKAA